MNLKLLAKVDGLSEVTTAYCAEFEAKYSYFRRGYVSIDLPRGIEHTDEIREKTVSFALADENGTILPNGTFKSLATAEKARLDARPTFSVDIALPEEVPA